MRRRIGFRWIRNGRRPAPDKSADRDADAARNGGAPEPEPDLDRLDPFAGGSSLVPDPTLTVAERREAEEEARHGVPTPEALAPSPGERRVESRFLAAMAAIRSRADASLGQLEAALRRARTRIPGLEGEAAAERKRLGSLAGAAPVCHRIETRYRRAETAARELAGFRRRLGLPDYASPRPSSRSWAWLLIGGGRRRDRRQRSSAPFGIHRGGRCQLGLRGAGHGDERGPPGLAGGRPDLPADARCRPRPPGGALAGPGALPGDRLAPPFRIRPLPGRGADPGRRPRRRRCRPGRHRRRGRGGGQRSRSPPAAAPDRRTGGLQRTPGPVPLVAAGSLLHRPPGGPPARGPLARPGAVRSRGERRLRHRRRVAGPPGGSARRALRGLAVGPVACGRLRRPAARRLEVVRGPGADSPLRPAPPAEGRGGPGARGRGDFGIRLGSAGRSGFTGSGSPGPRPDWRRFRPG